MKEEKEKPSWVARIARNGVLLALFCVLGMFSIPLGDNVKVSLQLFAVFLIAFLSYGPLDCLIVVGSYVALGLIAPIYAGFSSGLSATFGFVLGFLPCVIIVYFLNKIEKIHWAIRMPLSCLGGLAITYLCGTLWMTFYLGLDLGKTMMVAVVPYLAFDAIKIALATIIGHFLEKIPNSHI